MFSPDIQTLLEVIAFAAAIPTGVFTIAWLLYMSTVNGLKAELREDRALHHSEIAELRQQLQVEIQGRSQTTLNQVERITRLEDLLESENQSS